MYEEISRVQEDTTRKFITKVYAWMALALVITGVSAIVVVNNISILRFIYLSSRHTLGILCLLEFSIVAYLSAKLHKMSTFSAGSLFVIYAILNGVNIASLLFIYGVQTIGTAFLVTAGLFGIMSLYGYITKTDLTHIGNLFVMGLFGVVIATLANMFIRNEALESALLYIGVFVFIGLIGYDTQKIKSLAYTSDEEFLKKASIIGAMILYLDFINLFIRLVRLFGKKK